MVIYVITWPRVISFLFNYIETHQWQFKNSYIPPVFSFFASPYTLTMAHLRAKLTCMGRPG